MSCCWERGLTGVLLFHNGRPGSIRSRERMNVLFGFAAAKMGKFFTMVSKSCFKFSFCCFCIARTSSTRKIYPDIADLCPKPRHAGVISKSNRRPRWLLECMDPWEGS